MIANLVPFSIKPLAGENIAESISRTFQFGRYDLSNALPLIVALFVIIALLSTIIMVMSVRQRRRRYIPHGLINEPYQVRNVLQTAVDQRSRMEVLFSTHGSKVPAYCSPAEVNSQFFTVDCGVLQNFTGNMEGREISCFFKVSDAGRPQFFSFVTTVASMRRSNDIWVIDLVLPRQLERRQKRGYLRVTPPSEYVLGLAVWNDPADEKGQIPVDMRQWDKPVMAYVPPKREQVRLINLSAGGIRLAVPQETYKEAGLEFNLSNRFVVLMELLDIGTKQRLRFWTLGRIQNYYTDFATQDVEIGLQFLFYGRPEESEPTHLYWSQLPEGGEIESLGNWSMRCHLEEFRENEMAAQGS